MPLKKLLIQYAIALPVIFSLLTGVQFVKGKSLEHSIEFGVLWSVVSVSIFAVRRYFNYRKNISCAICNDLPRSNQDAVDGK